MEEYEINTAQFCDCKKATLQIDEQNDIYRIKFIGFNDNVYYKNDVTISQLIRYFENN